MQNTPIKLFDNISKGKVNFDNPNLIEWILGDMILLFYDNNGEQMVRICWKKRRRELTHIHINNEELEDFINAVNSDTKVICVKNRILWSGFEIIDKSKAKKQSFFRHYSI
ncbi:MAG: hypothetical protein NC184_06550 [Roseburia sp.]|nr:hypothetical protein [Roseburia sp.]